jgi:hypothetical protein
MSENTTVKHLWEVDHAYYCSASDGGGEECETWAEFLDEWNDADMDYNLLFRFDWHDADNKDNDIEDGIDELELFYVQQRKGRISKVTVKVGKPQENEIIEWLKVRLAYLRELWQPIA